MLANTGRGALERKSSIESRKQCKNATVEACSVLSDCRKAGVPDESRRNSVGSDQERRPRSMSQTSAVDSAVTFLWHPSKSPSLASRGSPRARQRRRCCSVRSAVLSPNSVGSDQRAPTTKNESDNSGTEIGVQLLQPVPRSGLQVASWSNLLSAMLALLSSFAFASRDSRCCGTDMRCCGTVLCETAPSRLTRMAPSPLQTVLGGRGDTRADTRCVVGWVAPNLHLCRGTAD